jgi:hypothetical protein
MSVLTGRARNPRIRHLSNCAIALGCELEDLIEDSVREWAVLGHLDGPSDPEEF